MAKRDKASALKALAKRPKLVSEIKKGNKKIKQLRDTVEKDGMTSSGGFIRSLIWAGIAQLDDNKLVSFVKGFKDSMLSDYEKFSSDDKPEKKEKGKPEKKEKVKPEKKEKGKPEKVKPEKKGKAVKEERENKKESKADIKPKKIKIDEVRMAKLIRPIKDIPANHTVRAEFHSGFWWVNGHRIATDNLKFVGNAEKK